MRRARLRDIYTTLRGMYRTLCGIYRTLCGIYRTLCGIYRSLCGIYTTLCGIYELYLGYIELYVGYTQLYVGYIHMYKTEPSHKTLTRLPSCCMYSVFVYILLFLCVFPTLCAMHTETEASQQHSLDCPVFVYMLFWCIFHCFCICVPQLFAGYIQKQKRLENVASTAPNTERFRLNCRNDSGLYRTLCGIYNIT